MSMPFSSERATVATSLDEETREEVLETRREEKPRLGREVGDGRGEDADDHTERVAVEKGLRFAEDVMEANHVAELVGVVVSGVRERRSDYPSKRIGNEVNMWERFASSWTNSTCRQT